MLSLTKRFCQGIGFLTLGTFGFAYYNFAEIRGSPRQLVQATGRVVRCAYNGAFILRDYQMNGANPTVHQRAADRIKVVLERNGGVYIKFGQAMGQMGHLLPKQWVKTMEPLCQQAPKSSYQDVKKTIQQDFKKELSEVFQDFQKEPVASASLAQVHKATLNGKKVAVKVQHRGLHQQCMGDIRLVKICLEIVEWLFPGFKYKWLGEQFERNLPNQLNFKVQARNCQKCAQQFKNDPNIIVPSVYLEANSERVLTMSFEEGTSITYLPKIKEDGLDLKEIARLLSTAFAKQIFIHGFVHCDPHPGNIFVRKAWNQKKSRWEPQLVLLDHGLYTELSEQTRLDYAFFWRGVLTQDEQMIRNHSAGLGTKFFQLLAAMVVNKSYVKIMDKERKFKKKSRLGKQFDQRESEELKELAVQYHKEVTQVLDDLNKEVILLFRCNEFVRSLDSAIGCPINTYEITAKYTWEAVKDQYKFTFRDRCKSVLLRFYFTFLRAYYWTRSLFVEDEEIENFIF